MSTFRFRTSHLRAPIVLVTPTDQEALVHDTTSLIIDSYEEPTTVTVDGTTVYNSSQAPSFLQSWTGELKSIVGGYRLILDPPQNFSLGDVPSIVYNTASYTLSYRAAIGTEALTSTNDADVPRIIDIDGTNILVGYARDTGYIYLRKVDPLTSETQLVVGRYFAVGHNPYTNKAAVVFNINGSLYLTEANPSDLPSTIVDPTILKEEIEPISPGTSYPLEIEEVIQGTKFRQAYFTRYAPIKTASLDDINVYDLGDKGSLAKYQGINEVQDAPFFISSEPPILRIPIPSSDPERSAIVGYYIVRYFLGASTYGRLDFVTVPSGDLYVDFNETYVPSDIVYRVIPVYRFIDSQVPLERGPMSPWEDIPDVLGADILDTDSLGASSYKGNWEYSVRYGVIKELVDENIYGNQLGGSGMRFEVEIEGYDKVGIGS